MRFGAFAIALCALGAGCHREAAEIPAVADPTATRTLAGGTVVGFTGRYGAHVWRGLPYAQPPVGPLRWRAPRPPAGWAGTRSALAEGPYCVQMPSVFGGVEARDHAHAVGQEDCLYLNVFAPRFPPEALAKQGARLPVMVWIHGGGNVVGHGGRYDGGALATTEQVIVVTINYRLGPFGWFRNAALRADAEGEDDLSGNYGTLDMIRALAWIRDNVAAFGGDPDNVTVFGESAGARDVFTLVLSSRARGLVHRAIVQSGGTATTTLEEAEGFTDATSPGHRNSSNEILLRLLANDGKGAGDRAAAKARLAAMSPATIAERLRALPAANVIEAYARESQEGLIDVPQLFRDGVVLPAGEPLEALARGDYNRIPTILGTNKDENKLFMALNPEFTWRLLGLVPVIRDPALYDATASHLSRHWKARGADEPAMRMRTAQGPPLWVYRFDWDEEPTVFTVAVSRLVGAGHGIEIPFVFGHWDLGSQTKILFSAADAPGRLVLSKQMMRYWASFARSGDPNVAGPGAPPSWLPFDAPDGRFLVLDTEAGGGIRMERGHITADQALAEVDADPVLATPKAKCDVYRHFVRWARQPTRAEYPHMVGGACAQFPLPDEL
jgi:para-nitrobenzyl esterase